MGLLHVGELVGTADTNVELVLADPGEEASARPQKLVAVGGVSWTRGGSGRAALLVRIWGSSGSRAPLDARRTMRPRGRKASRPPSKVSLPTES